MPVVADLHLHTCYSDGTWTPDSLAQAACDRGLLVIAITDHDTTEGVEETQRCGDAIGLTVVAGIEISTRAEDQEIHILGLGIEPRSESIECIAAQATQGRRRRAEAIVERLRLANVPLRWEQVCESAGMAPVGRVHVARALIEAGHVKSVAEAFSLYLGTGRPAYVQRQAPSPATAIEAIREAGGISICAHPGLLKDDGILAALADTGLDGIEVFHAKHVPAQVARYLEMSSSLELLVTGGSDCHGPDEEGLLSLGTVGLTAQRLAQIASSLPPVLGAVVEPESN